MRKRSTNLFINNNFELAITPNYGKIVLKIVLLFIGMIAPIIFLGIAAANEIINPKEINFAVVLPIYIAVVGVTTFLVIRKTHFKDTILLTNNSIQIPKLKDIHFDEIVKYKMFTARGIPSYIITFDNGKKMAFGPADNFSDESIEAFVQFIEEFEKKITNETAKR